MQKIVIIIATIVIVLGVAFLAVILTRSNEKTSEFVIPGKDGKGIQVTDFKKNAVETNASATTITQDPTGASIFYNEQDKTFSIVLNEYDLETFNTKRYAAEYEFLSLLGITREQACQLKVEISNIGSPEESIKNKTFPLSYCT